LLNTSDLRPNEARALAALFRTGGLSRASLARELSLTRSTTGILVQSLVDAGLAREREDAADEEGEAKVGRPGIVVEIDGNGAFFLGAYIGVNRIDVLAINLSGAVCAKASKEFSGAASKPALAVEIIMALVDEVLRKLPPDTRPYGLNIALPGFLSADGETYHAAILGWHGINLAQFLSASVGLNIPILLENDANAVAVSETYRSGQHEGGSEDSLVVLIENGVGGGIISGGRLHRGQLGGAGEIGHMPLGEAGFIYDAARPGRLETFIGKDALLARYAHIKGVASTLDAFVEMLTAGEPAALACARDWARWLVRGLGALACVLQPGRIILAGSVSAVYPFVAEQVEASLAGALVEGYPMPRIETSRTVNDGPALGAAYLLHQALLSGGAARPTARSRRLVTDRNFHASQRQ
jgi:predicted NBD/HSP70 family sugar kinase